MDQQPREITVEMVERLTEQLIENINAEPFNCADVTTDIDANTGELMYVLKCDAVLYEHTLAEEDEEEEEPQPTAEDFVLFDAGHLGCMTALAVIEGKYIGTYSTEEEALQIAVKKMETDQFWPNIWYLDDHGGWMLIHLDANGERIAPENEE